MRFFAILGCTFIVATATAAEVRLRASAVCTGAVVRLGHLAEIDEADPALAAALADIPLCPAPPAATELTLSQHDIRQLLTQSGVERTDVQVTGSERVQLLAGPAERQTVRPRQSATGIRQAYFQAPQPLPQAAQPKTSVAEPASPAAAAAIVPLVDRGASVNVLARAAGVRVATSGKALQPGAMGETILVELLDENKKSLGRVFGRVAGAQTVETVAGK